MAIFRASTPYDSKSESGYVFFAKVRKRERGGRGQLSHEDKYDGW
jgi:hypothetical protein